MTTVPWLLSVPAAVGLSVYYVLTQPELISDPIRRMVSETLYPIFNIRARCSAIRTSQATAYRCGVRLTYPKAPHT